MGERLSGRQEVEGSIPFSSTKNEVSMEAEIVKGPKVESKKEPHVQVCGYCNSWCYQGEYLHHDTHCQRPDKHN
jgi:hypothetical protein